MKILLAGSTGNIGSGVLDACLRDPSVTSIVALSRRPLEVDNPKLKTTIVPDFSSYSDEVLDAAITCDGAIWCLGIMARRGISAEEKFKITKGSITAFLEQLVPKLKAAREHGLRKGMKPFRLVWLGGMLAERDQKKDLWIISDIRKGLGQMVNEVASYADKSPEDLEIYFSQIGFVYDKDSWGPTPLFHRYIMRGIRKDEHGFALINVVENGNENKDLYNHEMKKLAEEYVRKKGIQW